MLVNSLVRNIEYMCQKEDPKERKGKKKFLFIARKVKLNVTHILYVPTKIVLSNSLEKEIEEYII